MTQDMNTGHMTLSPTTPYYKLTTDKKTKYFTTDKTGLVGTIANAIHC